MADQETTGATAVAETPEQIDVPVPDDNHKKKKTKKDDDGDLEYEVEFATPFGKLEFEFEPQPKKEKKDRVRKEKAARAAAKKAAADLAKRAEREASAGKRGGRLLPMLIIFGLVAAAIIVAYWLFARPEGEEAVPPEFAIEPEPAPQGLVARAKSRMREAVRAGRSASREAQQEQREKFERLTHGG